MPDPNLRSRSFFDVDSKSPPRRGRRGYSRIRGLSPSPPGRRRIISDEEDDRGRGRSAHIRNRPAFLYDETQDKGKDATFLFSGDKMPRQEGPLILKRHHSLPTERHKIDDSNTCPPTPVVVRERSEDATVAEFQAVYNPSNARDVTVHLELEVFEDIVDELEEFSRLTRIGNFREAKSFFEEHLRSFMGTPCVFVQYAEMLLRQGDYKSTQLLDDSRVFPDTGKDVYLSDIHGRGLYHNWVLIQAASLCFTQYQVTPIRKLLETERCHPIIRNLGLTETRIASLKMFLDNELPGSDLYRNISSADPPFLCVESIRNGRIWDFRDVFIEICDTSGLKFACGRVFDSEAQDQGLQFLFESWTATEPDESTLLVLLDIFTHMVLHSTETDEKIQAITEMCLDYADKVGDSLLQKFPGSLKSRPVLLWTLAKSAVSVRTQKGINNQDNPLQFRYLKDYIGLSVLDPTKCIDIPYYIPVYQENPGWKPQLPAKSSRLVEMVLEAAKERDDFKLQAMCLKELAIRSQNPSGLLSELAGLQKNKQHDMRGYLRTCLTQYLLCSGGESASRLRWNLTDIGWWDDPSDLLDSTSAAARDNILQALVPSSDGGKTPSMKAVFRHFGYVDSGYRQKIAVFLHGLGSRAESRYSRGDRDTSLMVLRDRDIERRLEANRRQPDVTRFSGATVVERVDDTWDDPRDLATTRVRERSRDRPALTSDRRVPLLESRESNPPDPKRVRESESKTQAVRASMRDRQGLPNDEISRDNHEIHTQHTARPRYSIEEPPKQSNHGPTVKDVPDEDLSGPPEAGEAHCTS